MMENMINKLKRSKLVQKQGFTLMELVIVLVIVAALLSYMIPTFANATANSQVQSTVATLKAIQAGAAGYLGANGSYSGISIAALTANGKYLPANTSATDVWGGAITVSQDTTNSGAIDIKFASVPSSISGQLNTAVGNISQIAPNYSSTNSTWTATV